MSGFKTFLRSGHWPTLLASFLYFDFCFAVWVLNGAMAPFISEAFNLSAAQKGFMISVLILAGAFMRFPLCVLSQYIGRKNAALVEMLLVMAALGGGFIPNAIGLSKQYAGTYLWGFVAFALLALAMLLLLLRPVVQIRWTRTWAEPQQPARKVGAKKARARA